MIGNRYIIKCICIDEGNDFGMNYNDVVYYNRKAKTFKYINTLFGGAKRYPEDPNQLVYRMECNPYFMNPYCYYIPMTKIMNNSQIFKSISEAKKICKRINEIGDFKANILVLKTTIEDYNIE